MSEKLSKYVSLSEVVHSDNAKRLKIDNNPTAEHLENLKTLSVEVFDKVREFVGGPLFISSGYRSEALNLITLLVVLWILIAIDLEVRRIVRYSTTSRIT